MAASVAPSPSVPPALLDSVVSFFHPHRVILFGSEAHGNTGPDSDIDLVVELDDNTPPEMLSAKAIQAAREGYHDPVDIIRRSWPRAPALSVRSPIPCCATG